MSNYEMQDKRMLLPQFWTEPGQREGTSSTAEAVMSGALSPHNTRGGRSGEAGSRKPRQPLKPMWPTPRRTDRAVIQEQT